MAPIEVGQQIGTLRVRLDQQLLLEQPLVAKSAIEEGGWATRMWDSVRMRVGR
ncbi:MAG: hypothetical protein R3E83_24355 [Burkholderiaceae bacterium]